MKLSIASDHGGTHLRSALVAFFKEKGYEVCDHGPFSQDRVDYPDFARMACEDVLEKRSDFAVLVCTSGVGMSMAANKMKGIRALLAINEDAAEFSRRHNNANVICFGEKYHTAYLAQRLADIFIHTPYEGGRHQGRLDKIACLERE